MYIGEERLCWRVVLREREARPQRNGCGEHRVLHDVFQVFPPARSLSAGLCPAESSVESILVDHAVLHDDGSMGILSARFGVEPVPTVNLTPA